MYEGEKSKRWSRIRPLVFTSPHGSLKQHCTSGALWPMAGVVPAYGHCTVCIIINLEAAVFERYYMAATSQTGLLSKQSAPEPVKSAFHRKVRTADARASRATRLDRIRRDSSVEIAGKVVERDHVECSKRCRGLDRLSGPQDPDVVLRVFLPQLKDHFGSHTRPDHLEMISKLTQM